MAGIGDMSGDVFGNGMLLSRKIRLVAAFNHQHIFLDPDPDIVASYRERQRLFKMGRSSWTDYREELISKGGGVFSRQAKQIRLSAEARRLLGTEESAMQPLELIRTILKMEVDLLWNGGIGTYVKASSESHADVGDRGNDNVRVDANELRCKVVGEGGNLGLTQRARIQFGLNGGFINTDFIDNSAGVDSSDREVNIKILLGAAEQEGKLTRAKRDKLLAEMTDEVAEFVLRNNYLQSQSISMMEARARERLAEHARLITNLEKTGLLDRDLEFLPDEVEIEERREKNLGLTRPELSVILSYAKIDLYNGLESSEQGLEDFLTTDPQRYFPAGIAAAIWRPDREPPIEPSDPRHTDRQQYRQSHGPGLRQARTGRHGRRCGHDRPWPTSSLAKYARQVKSGTRSKAWITRYRLACSRA